MFRFISFYGIIEYKYSWWRIPMPDNGLTITEEQERDEIWKQLYHDHPIDQQVQFSDMDIGEKLRKQPYIKLTYDDLYYKEKARYDQMSEVVEKITGIRYDYYRFSYDKEISKYEIEKYYLPKDPTVIEAKKKLRKQQWRVEFFKMCSDSINNQGWRIKEFLESMKQGLL
jgi:hypothetical protein